MKYTAILLALVAAVMLVEAAPSSSGSASSAAAKSGSAKSSTAKSSASNSSAEAAPVAKSAQSNVQCHKIIEGPVILANYGKADPQNVHTHNNAPADNGNAVCINKIRNMGLTQ